MKLNDSQLEDGEVYEIFERGTNPTRDKPYAIGQFSEKKTRPKNKKNALVFENVDMDKPLPIAHKTFKRLKFDYYRIPKKSRELELKGLFNGGRTRKYRHKKHVVRRRRGTRRH